MILEAINEIARQQSKPREHTKKLTNQLLDYLNTYPDAYLRYHASDMILHVHSDAAYLVEPGAKSRIAGYYFLSDHPQRKAHPTIAKAILVECKTLRHVVSSAAEAEMAGVHHNAQTAILIWLFLEVLQYLQPPTPIKTDNSTTNGFIDNNIHQRRSKSWDMRYHWLRDRESQKQFDLTWDRGINNEGDYFTKRHPSRHHLNMRPRYVCDKKTLYQ